MKTLLIAAMSLVMSGGFLFLGVAHEAQAAAAGPRVFLSTGYPSISGKTTSVHAGDNLQAAVNAANPGDTLVLDANATFTGPLTLPKKTCSLSANQCWIVIKSSGTVALAEGTRVQPAQAGLMAKIVAPGSNVPAIQAASGAGYYRLVGIEVTKINSAAAVGDLILLGQNTSAQTSLASVPHDIILDRVYAHGTATSDLKHCVTLNGASLAVIDSYISDCHVVGQDAQAMYGANGPGPFKIVNNYLEGSAENVLFGGDDPKISGLVPSDIEFRRNYVAKPVSWRNGTPHWAVKNLFELKNAQRVLIDGNIFENNWQDGQSGFAILFNTTNQGGGCPWCTVQDVIFSNNIVRHSGGGISMQGNDYHYPNSTGRTANIDITNNVFWDINSANWGGNGWLFYLPSGADEPGPQSVHITHNTGQNSSTAVYFDGYDATTKQFFTKDNFVYQDNIANFNSYGVFGTSAGAGDGALTTYAPDGVVNHNLFIDNKSVGAANMISSHPGNFVANTTGDASLQVADLNTMSLSTSSQYAHSASNGTAIGADIGKIQTAMALLVSQPGSTPVPTPIPVSSPTPIPSSGGGGGGSGSFPSPVPVPTPLPPVISSPIIPNHLYRADGDPKVYWVNSMQQKRWIPTLAIFNSYKFSWTNVTLVPTLNSIPNNAVVRANGDTRVYLINGNQKNWITSPAAFNSRGFQWQNIDTINHAELNYYRTGTPLY